MPVLSPSQHVGADGAVQGHQSADAGEGEAEAERNRREAFGGHDENERVALTPSGILVVSRPRL